MDEKRVNKFSCREVNENDKAAKAKEQPKLLYRRKILDKQMTRLHTRGGGHKENNKYK